MSSNGSVVHCPVSVLPSRISRSAYDHAVSLSRDFNVLIDRVSRDHDFLIETLGSVATVDSFTGHLLKILRETSTDKRVRFPMCLGLHRSDYMFDNDGGRPLQVEINTISSAFGCLTTKVTELHKYLISRWGSLAERDDRSAVIESFDETFVKSLPDNHAMKNIAHCIAVAMTHYQTSLTGFPLAVLMIVQPNEGNSTDQRLLEYYLWENYRIPVIRRTLTEVAERASLTQGIMLHHPMGDMGAEPPGELLIDGYLIGLAYFRAGYRPQDYPSENEWDGVRLIEKSQAIKCPSVGYHLAGSKKVQQALAGPGVLEKYVTPQQAQHLRTCFVGLWGLDKDDDETKRIISEAIKNPGQFVLKPQREGGGNNIWGQDIADLLSRASVEERSAYILMERIIPVQQEGVLLRNGQLMRGQCSSELGIFSGFVSDGLTIYLNQCNGHLLRTKLEGVNEGGVAAGYAVLDSPYLVGDVVPHRMMQHIPPL